MQHLDTTALRYSDGSVKNRGANWFYWLAIFSAVNSLIVYLFGTQNFPFAFGLTQWVDGTTGPMTNEGWSPPMRLLGLFSDLLIAGAFAGFGYLARRGNDVAWVMGIFMYAIDAILSIGLKDFWAFGFHLIGLFFLFKGLFASRHLRENATTF